MAPPRTRDFHPNQLRQLVKRGLDAVVPLRMLVSRGDPSLREVYLTFDDGPHPENTPRVLDALRELGAHGTFFVVGVIAEKHPDLVRRIVAEGHALGHHSYYHRNPKSTSTLGLIGEVRATRRLLRRIAGTRPTLFRPPLGALTAAKTVALWGARQTIVLWSIDPRDYAASSPAELTEWFDRHPLEAGDVVLLHDTSPHTPEALAHIVARGRERGLSFVRMQ